MKHLVSLGNELNVQTIKNQTAVGWPTYKCLGSIFSPTYTTLLLNVSDQLEGQVRTLLAGQLYEMMAKR